MVIYRDMILYERVIFQTIQYMWRNRLEGTIIRMHTTMADTKLAKTYQKKSDIEMYLIIQITVYNVYGRSRFDYLMTTLRKIASNSKLF